MVKFTLEGGATLETPDEAPIVVEGSITATRAVDVEIGQRLIYPAMFPGSGPVEVTDKEIV